MPPLPSVDGKGELRVERLCVNLWDILRMGHDIRWIMLGDNLDLDHALRMSRTDPDEEGVMFTCDLLQAACLVDMVRNHDRMAGDYATRVYVSRKGTYDKPRGWERVGANVPLTVFIGEEWWLNPKVFADKKVMTRSWAPKPRAVSFD
jgi:hypothetical protein